MLTHYQKAGKVASEALSAYHDLKAAIARLDLLALQQTEWGEQMTQKQIVMQEH